MSGNARIAETYTLPSKGLIYEEQVNPNVILGSMKTKHEMMRLSATEHTNKIMADIIDDCIDGDIGISSYDMCLGDYQYLLFKLRTVTYGPEYEMQGLCPNCGSENYLTVNLDELETNEYTDDLAKQLLVKLPETGSEVLLTLQTPRILDNITRMVRDRRRKTKNNEDPTLLYTITTSIEQIDGEEVNPFTLEEWVKDLPMSDTNILLNRIAEINNKIGTKLEVDGMCTTCGHFFAAPFRITGEFFRPSHI